MGRVPRARPASLPATASGDAVPPEPVEHRPNCPTRSAALAGRARGGRAPCPAAHSQPSDRATARRGRARRPRPRLKAPRAQPSRPRPRRRRRRGSSAHTGRPARARSRAANERLRRRRKERGGHDHQKIPLQPNRATGFRSALGLAGAGAVRHTLGALARSQGTLRRRPHSLHRNRPGGPVDQYSDAGQNVDGGEDFDRATGQRRLGSAMLDVVSVQTK